MPVFARSVAFVFADPVRPIEILSAGGLAGWSLFILFRPDAMSEALYSAFAFLPLGLWAGLIAAVSLSQSLALFSDPLEWPGLRFFAMALASGLWTVIAAAFWVADFFSTGAHMYSVVTFLTMLSGIWLGWLKQQLQS